MKTKIAAVFLGALCIVLSAVLLCGGDPRIGSYDYRGYVTGAETNDRGQTVLNTVSRRGENSFVLRWYSRVRFGDGAHPKTVQPGDAVRINTGRNGKNVRELYAEPACVLEGRLVADDRVSPVLLLRDGVTGEMSLVWLANAYDLADLETGDLLRVWAAQTSSVVFNDAVKLISRDGREAFTEEERAYLREQGISWEEK